MTLKLLKILPFNKAYANEVIGEKKTLSLKSLFQSFQSRRTFLVDFVFEGENQPNFSDFLIEKIIGKDISHSEMLTIDCKLIRQVDKV